ncbi:MAG: asparagine synthase (glutamine-hydrolyzing) [Planctomycetota bacterium]|jgi:asparagine synthase (glutamine-hydrolysing)
MCGIAGIVSSRGVGAADVERMTRAVTHRGPDDEGFWVGPHAALGHRRLSIIDLDGGHQPMTGPGGATHTVFNGEIYNYRELREELAAAGCRFRTTSDTEVILHLYEREGADCVRRLRGMFAFAIWDERARRLFAARDRLGQKPFYYAADGGTLRFGSEIKALLAGDPGLAELDVAALDQYLTLRVVAPPRSMFRRIRKLPPGHALTFDLDRGVEIERYWDLAYEPKLDGSDDELLAELETRMVECLRLHLVSDVPVGAFMSGGLDSTLVVAMIMHHGLADDFRTFSVGLPYGKFDEAPAARLVAERYGTRHHEQVIRPSLLEALPRLVHHLDEPSDPLAVCQDLIAGIAREHVKVVLGGEGGDELFGGYDRYYGNRYASWYALLPRAVRRYALGPALRLVPDGRWYKSPAHQLKWMHALSFHDGGTRYAKSLGYFYFADAARAALYGPVMREAMADLDPDTSIRDPYDRVEADDMLDRMLYADSQVRLPDHPVMILDRMTMAHGLEARAPFMDHELAEFAARLPVRLKVRGRCTRYIQRRLCEKYLPAELLSRPKQGFQSALPYMLRDEYRLLFDLFLGASTLARDGLLDQAAIDRLLREHLGGRVDHGNRLWLVLNSEVWYRMFIDGESADAVAGRIREHAPRAEVA